MKKAVILMSGGVDSTTVLAIAQSQGFKVFGLSFDYGQRHVIELESARKVASFYNIPHQIFNINLSVFGGSSLTDKGIAVKKYSDVTDIPKEITNSYVPSRNLIFLSVALSYAEIIEASDIFCGPNKSDYDNYPDCRPSFYDAFTKIANIGTKYGSDGNKFNINTPLIDLTKEEIIKLGTQLGVDYSITLSCYSPDEVGRSCGQCLSCKIRQDSFKKAGIKDPTNYITI